MPSTTPQAERLRRDLNTLTAKASSDLALLWRQFNAPDAAKDALMDVLPQLIEVYGLAAGTLAADWYDDLRDAAAAKRRFRAIVAEFPSDLGTDELTRWGLAPVYTAEPDWAAAQTLVEGGMTRRILNQSRNTVTGSAIADPSCVGWKRIGAGACGFCRMLIQREELYSEATADFASHDHCHCSAYPLIQGAEPINVKDYIKSSRNITDADRARAREYIRTH